jgi:hypothetical protein
MYKILDTTWALRASSIDKPMHRNAAMSSRGSLLKRFQYCTVHLVSPCLLISTGFPVKRSKTQ